MAVKVSCAAARGGEVVTMAMRVMWCGQGEVVSTERGDNAAAIHR
jgi:hypothetical protein